MKSLSPPFIPKGFVIPLVLETDRVRLRMLTTKDAKKDFEAVISSEEHLKTVFMPDGTWPSGLTLESNVSDLERHETEFQMRTSFAYTVVDLNETRVMGCVYIYPTRRREYDTEVWMWVRQSHLAEGLDAHLFETVKSWIDYCWPFENPAYPCRQIDYDTWKNLPIIKQ